MIDRSKVTIRAAALIALLAVATACGSDHPTAPPAEPTPTAEPNALLGLGNPRLLNCPGNTTTSDTATISVLGGLLSAAGTIVTIPLGALLEPQEFTLTVPASTYMEVDVSASGFSSFLFLEDISVTIDYSRCSQGTLWLVLNPLKVYHIDPATKALLELMPSVNDVLARKITFWTDHLSGYAIAY